jgi:tetratricopeptide (TPR) repeat protein
VIATKRNLGLLVAMLIASSSDAQISERLASDAVETVSGLDLSLNQPVTPDDFEIAMHLLSMAVELDPNDADLARSLVEAAWMAGDQEEVIRATRLVIRSDPRDTVAQLRLISSIINREQTVEGRVAAFDRFLGPEGQSIDPAVRSRLTMDLALLERERGNETGFLSALRRAAKLDTSNKTAQSLVAQHYSNQIEDSATRMRLQLRVLNSDPLDPHLHLSIARMCAAEGATDAAWRFLNNAIRIYKIDNGKTPALLQEQQLSLLWQYEGPQAILDELNPSLIDERTTLQARIDARIAASEPIDDLQSPEDIRYERGIDQIRLLSAFSLGDQETVDSVLRDLQLGLNAFYDGVVEQLKQRGANRVEILGTFLREVVSYQTMRAIVGVEQETIKRDMARIIENAPELEPYFQPFEPFSLFAGGEYEASKKQATETLKRSGPRDLIIALSSERLGQTEEAIEIYTQLTLDYALEAAGAYARTRLKELTGNESQITEVGEVMQQLAANVPQWFDNMITNPENTMALKIEPVKSSFEYGEHAGLRITLTNRSTLPLSLGSSHPIDSNFLIVPGFRETESNFQGVGSAQVVDLGRRLRLKPLESVSFVIDPDSIQTRWLIHSQPQSVIRQRWRALQGFKPLATGGIVNSPFGLVSESPLIERKVLPESRASAEQLIEGIGSDDATTFRRSVQGAAVVMNRLDLRPDLQLSDIERIVDALWDAYERVDTTSKVWILGSLPVKAAVSAMASFDERVQQTVTSDSLINPDIDATLVAMVLMTRVDSMNSPIFDVARAHSDPRLGSMAEVISSRIENVEPMYSGVNNPFQTYVPDSSDPGSFGF